MIFLYVVTFHLTYYISFKLIYPECLKELNSLGLTLGLPLLLAFYWFYVIEFADDFVNNFYAFKDKFKAAYYLLSILAVPFGVVLSGFISTQGHRELSMASALSVFTMQFFHFLFKEILMMWVKRFKSDLLKIKA